MVPELDTKLEETGHVIPEPFLAYTKIWDGMPTYIKVHQSIRMELVTKNDERELESKR